MALLVVPWIATLAIISITLYFYTTGANKNEMKKLLAPKAGGGWPFIGHLLMLSGPDPLHITLSSMADKHGPIFSVGLGTRRGLIINSWEAAKECYRTNDLALSNRPGTAAMGLMGYDFAMFGFSNYGPYWREMRKISVLRLLSNRKVEALGGAREVQTRAMLRKLYGTKRVDMREVFGELSVNLMARMVGGGVETEGEKWRETIRSFFKMMTVFTISDVVPGLKWMDRWFGGMHEAFKRTGREFDGMLQAWLEEHKRTRSLLQSNGQNDEDDDFMTEMLSAANEVAREFPTHGYDADTINKATCQTMMVGGTDTGTVTLIWALSLLLNNRHTLERAQQELDLHVGRDRLVQESDIEKLVYIQAIVKETLRLQPPIPVNPREAREDCVVAGYHIPKGTRIFVNTWKIQRDPRVWNNPLEFKPERFLTSDKEVDVLGFHFQLLPFGGGRRVCPAISFALRAAQLALATLVQGFDISTPLGEAVDMQGSFGTTNMKATPLEVCLNPRLSPQFYA